MNLRKENGFTGIDISVALIIIIIFVGIIATLIYNFEIQSKEVKRKSEATSIIIDILEYAKNTPFEDVNLENLNNYKETKYANLKGYDIQIICENDIDILQEIELNDSMNMAKKVTVNITYLVEKDKQNLNIYTWILKN